MKVLYYSLAALIVIFLGIGIFAYFTKTFQAATPLVKIQREYDRAIAKYEKDIAENPKDAVAFNNRGVIYSKKGEFEKARQDYTQAIKLDPASPESYHNRSCDYIRLKDWNNAIADASRALSLAPSHVRALECRAIAYEHQGKFTEADTDYRHALILAPKDAAFYLNYLEFLLISNNTKSFPETMAQFKKNISEVKMRQGQRIIREYLQTLYLVVTRQPAERQITRINVILKNPAELGWSFDDVEKWLKKADNELDAKQQQTIRDLTEKLKRL